MGPGNSGSGSLKAAWTVRERAKPLLECPRIWPGGTSFSGTSFRIRTRARSGSLDEGLIRHSHCVMAAAELVIRHASAGAFDSSS
jgi:hypothetical protein